MTDAQMPANVDAERAILGGILIDNTTYDQAASKIKAEDFSLDSHRRIFLRMEELAEAGRPIDFVTLTDQLEMRKEIKSVGGVAYVTSLTDGLPRVRNIGDHIKIVEDRSKLRQLIHVCNGTMNACYEQADTARSIYAVHDEQVLRISSGSDTVAVQPKDFSGNVLGKIADLKSRDYGLVGYSYGIADLDHKTTGIRKTEFTIIGGRPKHLGGKTALACQVICANCPQGIPVSFFSIEMNKEAILERLWSSVGKIPYGHIRDPKLLTDEEWVKLCHAQEIVDDWPLYIADRADVTIGEITAGARLLQRQHDSHLAIVDYMQIINGSGDMRSRMIKISRGLRTLARERDMAVIGLSQLARPADKNVNHRPEMWELKESGSLEADANTILLIFRPQGENGLPTGLDEIGITQRAGAPDIAAVTYVGNYMRFESRYLRGL